MASLHPISWRNGWILTKLAQLYYCDMKKNWLDFGDLDLIFKVTGGLILENGFSAPYLQNEWIDFDQTCTTILLREGKELIRFWWPWPMFKVTEGGGVERGHRLFENGFSASYLQNEWKDFDLTCTAILLWHGKELIRFWWPWPHFQGHTSLDYWNMACLHPISWRNRWILTKLAQLYCCDMEKNWLDFGDLDPIFKVTGGLMVVWKWLFCILSPEWMDRFWPNLYSYIVVTGARTD